MCLSEVLSYYSDLTVVSYNYHEHMHLVCLCARHAVDICFLLDSYLYWRKISDEFACQGYKLRSRSVLEGSRGIRLLGSQVVRSRR